MADSLSILIKAVLSNDKKDIEEQIKLLSSQIKERLELKLKIDASDLKVVDKQISQIKNKIRTETVVKGSQFINEKVEHQAFDKIAKRISDIRKHVDELAKVDILTDKEGQITSATLTYYNKQLAQTVKETMGWSEAQEKINGELIKTKTFETQGFKYSDDMAKANQEAEKLRKNIEAINIRNFNFGTLVPGVDASTFSSSDSFLAYIKKQYGNSAELIGKFNEKQLKTGEIITQANFRVKEGSDKWRMYQATLNKTTGEMRLLDNGLKDVINRQISWNEATKIAITRIMQWGIATSLVYGSFHRLQEAIGYIVELDNSLNEIRIVTNKTQDEVNKLAKSYNSLAKEMGTTTKEIASTAADLYRQGLDDSQVEERMRAIIQYAKISQLSVEESNKIITATANATGESVQKIIDIFAFLGDMTASGADEIGEALQKVAGTAESMSVSIEKASAWIATISSKTRESASVIGNSLKSMMARYAQIKEKGFNEEDATNINMVTKALKEAGIVAVDESGQLRNFGDVIDELMTKWPTLDENTKRYVATTIGGTYQLNRFLTLMENADDAIKNYQIALNAAGTANQKFAIYQESSQAKIDKFVATMEGLYDKFISSDFLKGAIDGATEFLNIIDRVTTGLGGFNTVLLLVISTIGIFKTKAIVNFVETLTLIGLEAGSANIAIATLRGGMLLLSRSIQTLGASLLAFVSSPVGLLTIALTAIPAGILWWINRNQKLIETQKELNDSVNDFNNILNDFNKSLSSMDLSRLESSLERIKKAVDYDNTIEKINKLKTVIANYEQIGFFDSTDLRNYELARKELQKLEKQIDPYIRAEKRLAEAKIESQQAFKVENGMIILNTELLEKWAASKSKIVQNMLKETVALAQQELAKETEILNKRLKNYGLEIEALKTVAEVRRAAFILVQQELIQEVLSKRLKNYDPKSSKPFNILDATSELGLSWYMELASKYEKQILDIGEKQAYLKDLLNRVSSGGGGVYIPPASASAFDSKKSLQKEPYTSKLEAYYNQLQVITDKENELSRVQKERDLFEGTKRIPLIEKEIALQQTLYKLYNDLAYIQGKDRENLAKQFDSKVVTVSEDYEVLNVNMEAYNRLSDEEKEKLDELIGKYNELTDAYNSNLLKKLEIKKATQDLTNEINKLIEASVDERLKGIADSVSSKINSLKDEQKSVIDNMEKALEQYKKTQDAIIEKKEKELELLRAQYEEEDKLRRLRELDEELAKVRADTHFEYINALGEVEYTYDKARYNELLQQRNELLQEYQRDEVVKAKEKEIEELKKARDLEIKHQEEEIEKTKENYETRIEEYENFQEILVEMQNAELESLRSSIDDKIEELKRYEEAWREHAQAIAAIRASMGSYGASYSGSSGGSSSGRPTPVAGDEISDDGRVMHGADGNTYVKNDDSSVTKLRSDGTARTVSPGDSDWKYIPDFHSGLDEGFVGGKPFDSKTETIAKLLKNEIVFTKPQFDNIIPNVLKTFIPKIPHFVSPNRGAGNNVTYQIHVDKIVTPNPVDFFKQINHLVVAHTGS